MIYTIQRRSGRDCGSLKTWYEAMSYTHISTIGCYCGGETLMQGTRKECIKYFESLGYEYEIRK